MLLATFLGGLIGFERELNDQPAGFRTHILVALGAALFTLTGAYGIEGVVEGSRGFRYDPTRVAAQVVTGIGFLGAGAIIQQGLSIRGLTTAASLWVTAAIGVGSAVGYYSGTITVAVVMLVVLLALKPFEEGVIDRISQKRRKMTVEASPRLRMSDLRAALAERKIRIDTLKIVSDEGEAAEHYVLNVRLPRGVSPDEVLQVTKHVQGVRSADWYA
ncbi:MAG TPA: MgtC/SapB family protein [Actinomycetota bacterium]|nr:MgtC/SapB family protein [Actinomycetota bacterium]